MDHADSNDDSSPTIGLRGSSNAAAAGGELPDDELVGLWILDQYRIVRVLAQGGMGRIYLAEQPSMDRYAAIKVLPARIEPEWRRRFHQEARAVSRLSHPNIITVYNFGELDNGSLFLAMEFLDGISLADVLGKGALPVERALSIARQCAAALSFAHGKGVIHCDFKPDNVMVQDEDRSLLVKIVDFGLARLLELGFSRKTATLFGTPRYISPEQWAGEKTTALSDQYAFGLVLYEMLAGVPAFSSESPLGYLHLHQNTMPRPLSSRLRGEDLTELDQLILRLLAKNPGERLATMAVVEKELERFSSARSQQRAMLRTSVVYDATSTSVSADAPLRVALAGADQSVAAEGRARLEELGIHLVTDDPDLWLLQLPGAGLAESLVAWSQQLPALRTLLVVDTVPEGLEGADLGRSFPYLLIGSCPVDPLVVSIALRWMANGDRSGISLLPRTGELRALEICHSDQKSPAVEALLTDARAAGVRQWSIQTLAEVAEELVMNTIFDAPIGADGQPRHAHLDRSSAIALYKGEEAELRWMIDERFIVLSMRDPFGTLSPVEALMRTTRSSSPFPRFDQVSGGAGVGLHIIARATHHLFFGICPGCWSEVLALIDRHPRARGQARTVSVLHGLGQSRRSLGARLTLIESRDEATVRLVLQGEIVEDSRLDPIFAHSGQVRIDLSGVTRINSMGLKLLLEAWRRRQVRSALVMERCSLAVVSQLNLLPLLSELGEVASILAPYFCSACDREHAILLHREGLDRQHLPPVRLCPDCDSPLTFDAVPEEYFAFLGGAANAT